MKKLLSVVLASVLILALFVPVFAQSQPTLTDLLNDGTTAQAQRFNADGSFRIMHITDTHIDPDSDDFARTLVMLGKMISEQQPDLIVMTGDICMSGDKAVAFRGVDDFMTFLQQYNIPVAVTFGNHDSENGAYTREELMAQYNKYECSISVDDGEALPGCGTYLVPVLASGSDRIAFNLWVVDSREYDGEGHYGFVTTEQIQWYVNKSNAVKELNGGEKVNSLMFQHIIVPEIYNALIKVPTPLAYAYEHIYNKGEYYILNPENTNAGILHEYPCPPYYNNGQYDAIVGQGDVLAMFFGHDHSNTFNISYRGTDLVNTPKCSYQDITSTDRGVRIIDINENDTSKYTSKVITFGDLYSMADISGIKNEFGMDSTEYKTALKVWSENNIWNILTAVARTFVRIFTGRTVEYK